MTSQFRTVSPWGSGRDAAPGGIVVMVVGIVVVVVVVLDVVVLVVVVEVVVELVVLEVVELVVVEDVVEVVELVVGGGGGGVTMQVTFPRVAFGSEALSAEQLTISVIVVGCVSGGIVVLEVDDDEDVIIVDEVDDDEEMNVVDEDALGVGIAVVEDVVVDVVVKMGSIFGGEAEIDHEMNSAFTVPVVS